MRPTRLPRGFGKNYFTLSAITATVSNLKLNKQKAHIENSFVDLSFDDSEDAPPTEDELLLDLTDPKPHQCNCYFSRHTKKALLLHFKAQLQRYYFKQLNNTSPPINYANEAKLRLATLTLSSTRRGALATLSLRR
ncbi:MAG: hypothetical protein WCR69_01140 [Sulfuricurvum sp.]|jgi:hypothetical protein